MADIDLFKKDLDKDWQRYKQAGREGFDKEYVQNFEQKQNIVCLVPVLAERNAKIEVHKAGGDQMLVIHDFVESPKTRNFLYNVADLIEYRISVGCENRHIQNLFQSKSPERLRTQTLYVKNLLEKIAEFEKTNPHQTQINDFAKKQLDIYLSGNHHINLRSNYFRY